MGSTDTPPAGAARVAGPPWLNRIDWLLLFLVLAVAVFFRLWQQGQVPPGMNFDEAFESLEARRLLAEPGYRPVYFTGNWGIPPLEIYLTALAFLIAGEHMHAIRYVSAVAGIITIVPLYVLTRMLFPLPSAAGRSDELPAEWGASLIVRRFLPFVASLIMAVLPWHNAFSREGVEVVLVPLWTILAVLFLWWGLQTTKWWPFVVSGFFWGSAYYTYQAAWVLPGVLVLFVIYKVFQEKGFLRRYGWRLLLLALTAALVVLPLVLFAIQNPWVFAMRTDQVGVLGSGGGSQTPAGSLIRNAAKVAGVFIFAGPASDGNKLYTRPPLPLLMALIFYLGTAVALLRAKRAEYALLLIWLVWMAIPSVLSDDAPSIRRMIGLLPAVTILIALGMGWLLDAASAWARSMRQKQNVAAVVMAAALSALLIYTTIWGYQYLFVDWGRDANMFHIFDVGLVDIGKYAAETPANTRLYYTPAGERSVTHLTVTWQVRDRDLRTFDGQHGLVLAPSGPDPTLYMVTEFMGDQLSLPALQAIYPMGRVTHAVSNDYGVPHSSVFTVDANIKPSLPMQTKIAVQFDEGITLLGSSLSSEVARPGEPVTVTLFWQAEDGPTQMSHTVFTHLLGPAKADGSILWAQHDGPPLGNSYPTTRWDQGEIIVDRHTFTVPADAPSGTFQIEAGLYTPERGGVRLRTVDAVGQPTGDSLTVGAVIVP